MVRIAVVGLGKMGLSHLSMIRALDGVEVVGVCDATAYLLGVLGKYTGLSTFSDFPEMLDQTKPDGVIIATPTRFHAPMVKQALERRVAVFCEKPFCLDIHEAEALVGLSKEENLVTQVGYHNRFVGTFKEIKRLLDLKAIGDVTHGLAEAYGPVVLETQRGTWRSERTEGGGALFDYAAHPINLINWYLGMPLGVGGTVLNSVFSQEIDDEVSSTMFYSNGSSVQLSVNWSDESVRKMTTKISLWGTAGKIVADRQEVQVYLRDTANIPDGYSAGWNSRYTTDLTEPVQFYLRGEEYSAELEYFVTSIAEGRFGGLSDFESAYETDRCMELILTDSQKSFVLETDSQPTAHSRKSRKSLLQRAFGRK